jgi:hypothetical protein
MKDKIKEYLDKNYGATYIKLYGDKEKKFAHDIAEIWKEQENELLEEIKGRDGIISKVIDARDALKAKLALPQNKLNRVEVEKIVKHYMARHNVIKVKAQIGGITYDAQTAYRENHNEAITAILNLAIPEQRHLSREEVLPFLEDLVISTLADSDGGLLFKSDYEPALDGICKLAIKPDKDRIVEVLKKYKVICTKPDTNFLGDIDQIASEILEEGKK